MYGSGQHYTHAIDNNTAKPCAQNTPGRNTCVREARQASDRPRLFSLLMSLGVVWKHTASDARLSDGASWCFSTKLLGLCRCIEQYETPKIILAA